jgi:hypothetical protein
MPRNSFGPEINLRFRVARSSSVADFTTLAGLAAVLSFVINATESDDDLLGTYASDDPQGHEDICMWPFLRTLLRSAEQMAGAQS